MSSSAAREPSRSPSSPGDALGEAVEGARTQLSGVGRQDGEGEAPHRAIEVLGRVGLAGYGLVHLLIGAIAVQIAVRGGGQADQQGALSTLAAEPFGFALIVVIVIGLVAFGIWQIAAAATGFRWASGWDRLQRRIAAGATAAGVLFLALIGVQLLATGSSGSSSSGSQQTTAGLLALPGGRLIVGVVALVVLVVAGSTAWTGIRGSFGEDLAWSRLPDRLRGPVHWLGIAGHVLRAVAFAVMAVLFGVAAVRSDPGQAGGLDAALKTLAGQPFGPWLLVLVALGFVAYGLYCGAEAWARRI
ncbi:hypothetical protein Acsp06_19480 [Actinomycetospora sp. NBRC 106375]|uniref:DUF1206 domain-containing protein n=1 Tax=Actinomycetospora sp. NBRC 106375 TaxID=3032207 RepID=UPI0024A0E636|nr:DUF1206 domain-containing protein [Actinomycetospora sp. NBRC 106375]GLZ45763.1 hypothetical protein Acsp06_19480 [Actinomycetospora sp. NBRC 106375]